MSYNTVNEIKDLLLLETENQTLSRTQIETYLSDAQEEVYNTIQRNRETDSFVLRSTDLNDDDEREYVLYFVAEEILEVRDETNNEVVSSDHYELIRGSQAIKIKCGNDDADLSNNIQIEIDYIPKNYKMLERAIVITNILTRLQPFSQNEINPSLSIWNEKKKNYERMILGKFGTGFYY